MVDQLIFHEIAHIRMKSDEIMRLINKEAKLVLFFARFVIKIDILVI